MLVHQILKSKDSQGVVTLNSDAKVSEAVRMLADKRIGALVVSDDGVHALGILSERDVVREMARSGASCMDRQVKDHMTSKLGTCTTQTTVDDVLAQMTEGRFRHVPVVENGEMVGLISIGDVVKAQLSKLSMEKTALEGMIMGY